MGIAGGHWVRVQETRLGVFKSRGELWGHTAPHPYVCVSKCSSLAVGLQVKMNLSRSNESVDSRDCRGSGWSLLRLLKEGASSTVHSWSAAVLGWLLHLF